MVTQKLISLFTWQEEGEGEREGKGWGRGKAATLWGNGSGGFPTAQNKTSRPLKI